MNIHVVPAQFVDEVFPKCVDFFQRAIDKGNSNDIDIPYLLTQCRGGYALLFVNGTDRVENAMIIRFEHPKIARVLVFGGEGGKDWIEEFKKFAPEIRPYANKLVFHGRKGWERKIKELKVKSVLYEMDI